jgi:hypothetical protein
MGWMGATPADSGIQADFLVNGRVNEEGNRLIVAAPLLWLTRLAVRPFPTVLVGMRRLLPGTARNNFHLSG